MPKTSIKKKRISLSLDIDIVDRIEKEGKKKAVISKSMMINDILRIAFKMGAK